MEKRDRKEKILVFSSREICYMSSRFFANRLGAAFEELGFDVCICEMAKGDDPDAKLAPYIGQKYRLIVDFNSMLPRMELDDGTPYPDALEGLFYDYILDHPLFHYNGLTGRAKNLHALVLDEAQRQYVMRYYPGVADVHTLPLGATEAVCGGGKEPERRILFPGTYDSPDAVYEMVKAAPEPLQGIMKELIARRIEEPLLPMEEAFRQYLAENGPELSEEQFALFMNSMYPVDAYIRDYFRKTALDALLADHIPVTVIGEGWEKYHVANEASLRRERAVPFALSFERIAKAHVLLNVSPIFNRGMHDRIPAGMANRTVVLTDSNPWLAERFADERELVFYSLYDMDTLCGKAERLLYDDILRGEIAERAYAVYQREHTWKCRAKELLGLADAMSGGQEQI